MKIKLKEIREERKITLNELARISGISKSHLNYIENGERIPTIDIICKLAKALKCSPENIYECDDKEDT